MTGANNDDCSLHSKKAEQTKAKTKAAFLDLCSRKRLDSITIKELTALAGINRSTFYSHYTDIYDLREQILDDFTLSAQQKAIPAITDIVNGNDSSENVQCLTDFYNENIAVFRAFISKNLDPQLTDRIQTIAKSLLYRTCGEVQIHQSEQLEYLIEYMAAGHIALIGKWAISESTFSAEELIKLIRAINVEGPIKYLLTYVRS